LTETLCAWIMRLSFQHIEVRMVKIGFWMQEIRAPFLSLSVALVFLGTAVGLAGGSFSLTRALLALVGLLLVHASVNLLNEYSDFRTGIDFHTLRTPFSGGSGMLTAGKISPPAAHVAGIGCLAAGGAIGCVLMWLTNIGLLPLLIIGGFSVYFYTDVLARNALGEVFAGLGLGLLPILGASFIQTGHYSGAALAAGIPAGILTLNVLLLNEFPDLDADVKGGRRNLLTVFGKEAAGKIYTLLLVVMYGWIAVAVIVGFMPVYCLAALFTLVTAWRPMMWAWNGGKDIGTMIPALGDNVVTNLATQTVLGLGFLCSVYV